MEKVKSTKYWESLSKKIQSPTETKNKRPDTSDLEITFLMDFLKTDDDILDIGSGSGLIINKLIDKVGTITAVEKYEGFTRFIVENEKILVINAEIIGFKIRKLFDAVLCFGVAQCFERDVMACIYANMYDMIKPGGLLIVRTHCGLEVDKIVDGFSEELQTEYYAEYRQVDKEEAMLKNLGFESVERYDIFPDTLNVWPDTRHFIFVCKKA